MNTILVRDSEEPGVSDFTRGDEGGYRPQSCWGKSQGRRRSAIFLTGASLALALAMIEPAGAANAPGVVGAATQGNPLSNSVNSAVNGGTVEAPTHWAADTSNGCKVWNPAEIANGITARWSGRCENGFAQGPGTVRWLNNNKQMAELSGNMEQGKMRGHTTGVEEPGNRFDGMFIDSLPEGEGKANFSDGSVYSGMWHRGRQLGYGIMTFPPAHPQYPEMLNSGKGKRTENGTYELRGWWEGKTFIIPCDSEDACEKALVAQIKREQDAAAAKAGAPAAPAPAAAVVPATGPVSAPAPVIPAAEPVATTPAPPATEPAATTPATPAAEPVATTPAPAATEPAAATPATPVAEPVATTPAPPVAEPAAATPAMPAAEPVATTPTPPVTEPAAAIPATPAAESVPLVLPTPEIPVAEPAPVTPKPDVEPVLAPATPSALPLPATPATEPSPPAPGAPDAQPASVPAATAPIPELPAVVPVVVPSTAAPATPSTPAAEPVSDPAPPAGPDDKPAVVPTAAPVT